MEYLKPLSAEIAHLGRLLDQSSHRRLAVGSYAQRRLHRAAASLSITRDPLDQSATPGRWQAARAESGGLLRGWAATSLELSRRAVAPVFGYGHDGWRGHDRERHDVSHPEALRRFFWTWGLVGSAAALMLTHIECCRQGGWGRQPATVDSAFHLAAAASCQLSAAIGALAAGGMGSGSIAVGSVVAAVYCLWLLIRGPGRPHARACSPQPPPVTAPAPILSSSRDVGVLADMGCIAEAPSHSDGKLDVDDDGQIDIDMDSDAHAHAHAHAQREADAVAGTLRSTAAVGSASIVATDRPALRDGVPAAPMSTEVAGPASPDRTSEAAPLVAEEAVRPPTSPSAATSPPAGCAKKDLVERRRLGLRRPSDHHLERIRTALLSLVGPALADADRLGQEGVLGERPSAAATHFVVEIENGPGMRRLKDLAQSHPPENMREQWREMILSFCGEDRRQFARLAALLGPHTLHLIGAEAPSRAAVPLVCLGEGRGLSPTLRLDDVAQVKFSIRRGRRPGHVALVVAYTRDVHEIEAGGSVALLREKAWLRVCAAFDLSPSARAEKDALAVIAYDVHHALEPI